MQPSILLAEDEESLVELLSYNLEAAGFCVDSVSDGDEVLLRLDEIQPDLLLLDWMLPNLSGIEICRRIRRNPAFRSLPVIMLTARADENDRVRGLDVGADDYLVKPFSMKELLARMRALLRRTRPALAEGRIERGAIIMDMAARRVTRNGSEAHLGPTEFRLLQHFMESAGRVMSRAQLLDAVWGRDIAIEERTVDVHVRRLRKALNRAGGDDIIRTVRSEGYAFEPPRD